MSESPGLPQARREPVHKQVGGITFTDDYAWLQQESPEALAWQWEQDRLAQDAVQGLPGFGQLVQDIRATLTPRLEGYARHRVCGGRHLWLQQAANGTSFEVWVADRIGDAGRVVVSSSAFKDAEGREGSMLFFEPSPDGRQLLVGVSLPGQSVGGWCLVDVDTGAIRRTAADGLLLSNCGLPGWVADGSAFFVQDRDAQGAQRVRRVSTTGDAMDVCDEALPADSVPALAPALSLQPSPGGRWMVAVTEPHHRSAVLVRDNLSSQWRRFLPEDFSGECHGEWLDDDTYAAIVTHDADAGRIVAIPAATSQDPATWRSLVPESHRNLRTLTVIGARLVSIELDDVDMQVHVRRMDGSHESRMPIEPFGCSVMALVPRRIERTEALILPYMSFVQAQTWYHYDLPSRQLRIVGQPGPRLEGVDVQRRFATSRDGTRVTYFEVRVKEPPAASPQPTLVTAYGGFGVAWMPFPLEHGLPFIRAGGVFVHACLRGGGEYGQRWRESGRFAALQNTYDDLYAVAEDLVARGVAGRGRLAFQGHSQGGMLAATVAVQRPDLWAVVCPTSPLIDMMEPLADTPAKAAIKAYYDQHYGDPADPEAAAWLYPISAYHNVKPGVRYPAIFTVFGEHDLGCPPFHGRKFVARLREAVKTLLDPPPVHLRVWKGEAHGVLDSDRAAVYAAEWLAFVMDRLGMPLETSHAAASGETR